MDAITDKSFCVCDFGLFTELAIHLARKTTGKVRSYVPWQGAFPFINDRLVGDGIPNIERIDDPLDPEVLDSTDVYCFPDIFNSGMQLALERLGKQVWGSRKGDELERKRLWFRKLQEELGLPVPEYTAVRGLEKLRAFLADHGRCFVKSSPDWRGTHETWESKDGEQSEFILDYLAVKFGPVKNDVLFMVEEPIEVPYEAGFDSICVDDQFSETPVNGIEIKGKLLLASAQTNSKTPKFIDEAMKALGPTLRERRYRNFMSGEFRDGKLTDPCCRAPNPGLGCEMEMISNLPLLIEAGSRGELLKVDFEYEFGVQIAIWHDHPEDLCKQFRIDAEVRQWVKLMDVCQSGPLCQIVPRPPHGTKIGWIVGVGNTIQEMADHAQEVGEALKDLPIEISMDALPEAIEQAQKAQQGGDEFTDQEIPDPASVLEEAENSRK